MQEAEENLLDYEAEEDATAAAAKPASSASAGAAKEKKCVGRRRAPRRFSDLSPAESAAILPTPRRPSPPPFFRGHFVGVHSSSFKDFMLKPELLRYASRAARAAAAAPRGLPATSGSSPLPSPPLPSPPPS